MSRPLRIRIAEETVAILKSGAYLHPTAGNVSIDAQMQDCLAATLTWTPAELERLAKDAPEAIAERGQSRPCSLEVLPETTFATCRRWRELGRNQVACLNFASARNPGGGFLNGSQAQEEALSRASGLYASLCSDMSAYEYNRKQSSLLYSDYMIWSHEVPVFRDDQDELLPIPYTTSIITSAAPNLGAIRQNKTGEEAKVPVTLAIRAEKILALALHYAIEHLVLGAWGCGVFGNDPTLVAHTFLNLLAPGRPYAFAFTSVAFSVPTFGPSQENYLAFQAALNSHQASK